MNHAGQKPFIVSHWMPARTSNFLNPSESAREIVGVVKGKFYQTLDRETYLELLAERLEELLMNEPDPETALVELIARLEDDLPDYPIPELPNDSSGNLYHEA